MDWGMSNAEGIVNGETLSFLQQLFDQVAESIRIRSEKRANAEQIAFKELYIELYTIGRGATLSGNHLSRVRSEVKSIPCCVGIDVMYM